jgi:hypothetical protein
MRLIFTVVAIALAILSPAAAQNADWQAFQPPGGGFQIEMPGKPQLKSEQRNGHKVDTVLVGLDKAAAGSDLVFMVKYQAQSEAPRPEAATILDTVVKAMCEGNTAISSADDDIGDFPARAFVMQDKDKDFYSVRVLMTDRYFVTVMFIGPPDNRLGKRFLVSFSVK